MLRKIKCFIKDNDIGYLVMVFLLVGFFLGACVENKVTSSRYRGQAIELGNAEYNQTNGRWQWITNNLAESQKK